MLTLRTLKSPRGTNKNTKRIGRGQGSGQGTQAGKGHKGQKARNGGGARIGFEGGQMPLYRRLPKVGFSNAPFKTIYAVLNLEKIAEKFGSEIVTRETLIDKGFLSGINKSLPIKLLAKGEFNKALTFKGIEKFSAKALELVKKAGGKVENA
ncbi:MAG TPA: 50S ribosomal protein L15 [Bacteriovoracaceae bacterium]|nr:50S ribosomal protein L15 [Bacteriovoracaceae bacterium]